MHIGSILRLGVAATGIAGLLCITAVPVFAESATIGETDLGGVVTSANGPEAGVWVIAETIDLPTKFIKIVVTDGEGRYAAGAAEGKLQRLGARLRARGFAEGEERCWAAA
jgi:hypothetical protein